MDVVLSLPFLVFALALVAVVGPSLTISVTVIAFFTWASVGRIARAWRAIILRCCVNRGGPHEDLPRSAG
jgi:ABC-type dipeptide/oligopeptide/nickel transport system permease subunit